MKNIYRVTYALAVLVLLTLAFLVATTRSGNVFIANAQTKREVERYLERRATFPVVDYDEPEPSDPVKRAAAGERQKRRNTLRVVATTPHPEDSEISLIGEGGVELEAVPVDKSDVIVVGNVVSGEAHMSGNKKNVVSEFVVQVEKVCKPVAPTTPAAGSSITVERFGGNVRYPNGQTVLYRWSGSSMPKVGGRYILFLESISQSNDYTILTGYDLDKKEVYPLDTFPEFEAYRATGDVRVLERTCGSLRVRDGDGTRVPVAEPKKRLSN